MRLAAGYPHLVDPNTHPGTHFPGGIRHAIALLASTDEREGKRPDAGVRVTSGDVDEMVRGAGRTLDELARDINRIFECRDQEDLQVSQLVAKTRAICEETGETAEFERQLAKLKDKARRLAPDRWERWFS